MDAGRRTMTESQREKAVRNKIKMIRRKQKSMGKGSRTYEPPSFDASASSASGADRRTRYSVDADISMLIEGVPGLPYADSIDTILSNPLLELVLGVFCIVLTGCSAASTFELSDTQRAVNMGLENSIIFVFSIEYIARWYAKGFRIPYLVSPLAIIDLCSILAQIWQPLVLLRFSRLLRFTRLLQKEDFVNIITMLRPAMDGESIAVPEWQLQLNRVLFTVFSILVITADLIYNVEHEANPQIETFFDALYFSTTSLNSVGYGDIVPVTSAGTHRPSVGLPTMNLKALMDVIAFDACERLSSGCSSDFQTFQPSRQCMYAPLLST